MSNRTTLIIVAGVVLIAALAGLAVYPQLPERVASHWNAQGEADGYSSRFAGVFTLPIILAVTSVFLMVIPAIDPRKANIARFRPAYNAFIVAFAGFFLYLHVLTLMSNLGYAINMTRALMPAIGAFLFGAGMLVGRAQQNWFIGIRTPWTLSSESVWNKTHQRGALAFKASGILTALGVLAPAAIAIWFMLVPVLLTAVYVVVYSYVEYQKEHAGQA